MLSKLVLTKCEEHEDCQLASEDDGDWQHTPASRPIAERMGAVTPEQQAQIDRILRDLSEAENHRTKASEDEEDVRGLLHNLTVTEAFFKDAEVRLNLALRGAEETASALAHRINTLESKLASLDAGASKLDRIDDYYAAIEDEKGVLETEAQAIKNQIAELNRRIDHEREERLAATKKSVKTDRLLAERIEGAK